MSYKVGDYVIIQPDNSGNEHICIITDDSDRDIQYEAELLIDNTPISITPDEILRPAVFSDWAKEIPEKYRNECADDERYIWLISYPNNEVGIVLSANNNSNQGYLVDEKWFIADALSAHYGIPILPYEQYKEYMKELKKGE